MSERSDADNQGQPQRRPIYIIITVMIVAVILCSLVISGIYIFNLGRNAFPANMPAEMVGTWERQGNIFAFCSNNQFPSSLTISPERQYNGPGGSLWKGGEFQTLIGERVRVETSDGNKFYNYDLLVLEDSSFLTFSSGLFNNCRITYFSSLGVKSE